LTQARAGWSAFQVERDLIQACVRGDAEAWDALRSRYGLGLRGALRSAGARASDLDDLEQEVWARLLSRDRAALRAFRGGSFGAFLKQVARTVCVDHHRRSRSFGELSPALACERPTVEHRLSEQQERSRFAAALDAAAASSEHPARDRDVLRLHFEEELSAAEIAELGVGLSARGVEALLRRVGARLRELLGPDGP
jgi:RNA polymerase sigma factor (sigma-70 family)